MTLVMFHPYLLFIFSTLILEIIKFCVMANQKCGGLFSFCPGEDESYEAEDRPEAKGGSEHLRHVDHLQRGGHEVSHGSFSWDYKPQCGRSV